MASVTRYTASEARPGDFYQISCPLGVVHIELNEAGILHVGLIVREGAERIDNDHYCASPEGILESWHIRLRPREE